MQYLLRVILCFFVLFSCTSWGFFAHKRINHVAVFALPRAMSGFYRANIDYITEHAVDPDKKRYVDSLEAPRHFIDADHYGKQPFARIPQNWYDAVKKYSVDTLNKYGTVPWVIQYHYYWLVKAFKAHDTTAILKTSAHIAHYIADASVPLHLTENYDGQITNQTGVHSLWETRVPELFASKYNLYTGKAQYVENPLTEAFRICRGSFACVDSVLRLERLVSKRFTLQQKYDTLKRGNRKVQDFSVAYASAYHKLLNGMVRRRLRVAISSTSNLWYSAWVDAGQPDLNKLIAVPLTEQQQRTLIEEETRYKAGNGW